MLLVRVPLFLILLAITGFTSLNAQQDTIRVPVPSEEPAAGTMDSLALRAQFVLDSTAARELFVIDSLRHRKQVLDSVTFLQKELPHLLNAWLRTVKEDIIVRTQQITITGDSALSDFTYLMLPFNLSDPYTPWKGEIALTGIPITIKTDKKTSKIVSVQSPFMKCTFGYGNNPNVLVIYEPDAIQNNWAGHFYKMPVDSVFFDSYNRVVKIKKNIRFYSVVNAGKRGALLFTNVSQVKQFEYGQDDRITRYQVVKFCDRWKVYDANKVCSIITYVFSEQQNTFQMTRTNDPANTYSDGTFEFAFDGSDNLQRVSFHNLAKTENWEKIIELNKEGNVHCYIDKVNNIIRKSLCMIYPVQEPTAKFPVETITTTFEDNGISYFQKNNSTGLSRTRDRMTLEWSPWR